MKRIEGLDCDCHLGHLEDGVTPCPKCKFGVLREEQAKRDAYLWAGHGDPIDAHTVSTIIPARYRGNEGKDLVNLFRGSPTALAALVWIEEWTREDWPAQKRKSVFLHGPVGTGKTTLAMYALKRFMEYGHRARVVDWVNFLIETESLEYQFGQAEVVNVIKTPVVLLDDLGSQDRQFRGELQSETAKRQDIVRGIVNGRMNKAVPTIITTNLTLDQFGGVWGERLSSRIHEDFKILEVNGADIRMKAGVNA